MTRERFLPVSAILFTLGSGVAAIVLGIAILESMLPAYAQAADFDLGVFVFGFSFFVVSLLAGMLLGAVLWLLVMRRWYSRDELAAHFIQPDVILVTPVLAWLFQRLYR